MQAEYGWLIFGIDERLPAIVPSFSQAADEVRSVLRREAADRLLSALVREARSRYTTVVHVKNLPFRYRGAYAPPN